MPFFKKSKKADLGSTASEVTLVDPSACQAATKGMSQAIKSKPKHPKQKPLTSEMDKWNTIEARLEPPVHASGLIYGSSSRAERDAFFRFYNLTVKRQDGRAISEHLPPGCAPPDARRRMPHHDSSVVRQGQDLLLRFVEDRQIPKAEFPAQQETVSILAQDIIHDINATSKVDQKCTLTATFGAVPFASRLVQPPIVGSDRCKLQKATMLVTGGVWPSDIGYLDTTVLESKLENGGLVPYASLVRDIRIAVGWCDCGSDNMLFKDVGDVIRRWPVHMVTMSW
ncbi:hypothetical protein MY1884_007466 [Beauveria asiatica]